MSTKTVQIPEDVYDRVRVIAAVTGTTPADLLSTAFDEYLENHREEIARKFELAQKMLLSGDVESILRMTKPARSRRAAAAAELADQRVPPG